MEKYFSLHCDPLLVDNILMLLEQSYNNTTDTVTFLVKVSSSNDDKGKAIIQIDKSP